MEPQIIDYYNNMPSGINVIDKMNEELDDLQKKYDELEKKYDKIKEFPRPGIRVKTIDEIKIYSKKIDDSIPLFEEIIYDFLNHRGWILEYDKPGRVNSRNESEKYIGHWWTWETDDLKWGDTTAHKFYDRGCAGIFNYNLYLKCKLLEELYKLFPEYTERKKGWFHQQIDASFTEVDNFLNIIFNIDDQFYELFNEKKIKDTVVSLIMDKLFGIDTYDDTCDYDIIIPNIIYYKCCDYKISGSEFRLDYDYEGPGWYKENNGSSHLYFCEDSFKCPGCGKSII